MMPDTSNERSAGDAGLRPSVFLVQLPGAPDPERYALWNPTAMNFSFFRLLLIIAICASSFVTRASARPIPGWSYETLLSQSDLVAIIEPLENLAARDSLAGDTHGYSTNDFDAINTRFTVHGVLKTREDSPTNLIVLHFAYSKHVAVFNGARFTRFLIGPLQYEKRALQNKKEVGGITVFQEKPVWLAFLKRRADGRFEPTSGQYDSALSFRELHEPSFFALP
jgi:hypothetical protein